MEEPSLRSDSPQQTLRPLGPARRPRWVRGLATLVAVALTLGGATYYVFGPRGRPTAVPLSPGPPSDNANTSPREIARLSEGSAFLDVPLMTMYSAPALKVRGFGTSVELDWSSSSAGTSANVTFQWSRVAGT